MFSTFSTINKCRRKAESRKKVQSWRNDCVRIHNKFSFPYTKPTQAKRKSSENFKGTTQQSAENENPNVNKNAALKAKTLEKLSIFVNTRDFQVFFAVDFFFRELSLIFARDGKMIEIYFGCLEVLIKLVTDLRSPLLRWRDCSKGLFWWYLSFILAVHENLIRNDRRLKIRKIFGWFKSQGLNLCNLEQSEYSFLKKLSLFTLDSWLTIAIIIFHRKFLNYQSSSHFISKSLWRRQIHSRINWYIFNNMCLSSFELDKRFSKYSWRKGKYLLGKIYFFCQKNQFLCFIIRIVYILDTRDKRWWFSAECCYLNKLCDLNVAKMFFNCENSQI